MAKYSSNGVFTALARNNDACTITGKHLDPNSVNFITVPQRNVGHRSR